MDEAWRADRASASEHFDALLRIVTSLRERPMRREILGERLMSLTPGVQTELLRLICLRSPSDREAAQLLVAFQDQPIAQNRLGYKEIRQIYEVARERGHHNVQRLFLSFAETQGEIEDEQPLRVHPQLAEVPLGRRKYLARQLDTSMLEKLLNDPEPSVIRNLLRNPKLTEQDVLKIATKRPNHPDILREIARSMKWFKRYRVKSALIQNPYTPFPISLQSLSFLNTVDLLKIARSPSLPVQLTSTAEEFLRLRELQQNTPAPASVPPRQTREDETLQEELRFDGQVAVVTGAGGGLGRIYALELAKRGAQVVVNDLGTAVDGAGESSSQPADEVVAEIKAAGGEAIANYDSVAAAEGGHNIVQAALDAFGRLDILINNAGILRDKSFHKMTAAQWEAVRAVHLDGVFYVTQPAFRHMLERGSGRIVMTSSSSGLYGNFGQVNYGAAKMGQVGLMNALKLEAEHTGIKINAIAPTAASRMTEDIVSPELFAQLDPAFVAPLVLFLCSKVCQTNGGIYNAGMGRYSRVAMVTGPGSYFGHEAPFPQAESLLASWEQLSATTPAQEYESALDALPNPREQALHTLTAQEEELRFDGQVAIITGAGRGLGREYALELARRGAQVVVNDLGTAVDGAGESSSQPADEVVAEIKAAGGEAIANYDSVATAEGGHNIVQAALDAFGRLDILINNAGILRDGDFALMTAAQWEAVRAVHLDGTFYVTQPAYQHMRQQGYGRILLTSSAAGLYGNMEQANYGAAKMAMVGLMNALKQEAARFDFRVNVLAPFAASRMTEELLPPTMLARSRPELVAPLAAVLVAKECPSQGGIFNAGMGLYNRATLIATPPLALTTEQGTPPSPEEIAAKWEALHSLKDAVAYSGSDTFLADFFS